MKKHWIFVGGLALLGLLVAWAGAPVEAAPAAQFTPFPTPTPGPDGRIVYLAQEGDSAWRIAAIYNIPMQDLCDLNRWSCDNPVVHAGDMVLLGYAGPANATPTAGPMPTATPAAPTSSPLPGEGKLCVILYQDVNGDSLRQEEEVSIAGGAISVADRSGSINRTLTTVGGGDYQCFEALLEGAYNVSVAVPDGYNATTHMNISLDVQAGSTVNLTFGAQANRIVAVEVEGEAPAVQPTRSPLLGIIGGVLLVAAVGLVLLAGRLVRTGK